MCANYAHTHDLKRWSLKVTFLARMLGANIRCCSHDYFNQGFASNSHDNMVVVMFRCVLETVTVSVLTL